MCWGLQIDIPSNARATGIENVHGFSGRIATANHAVPVLIGADGEREWIVTTFGIGVHSHGQFKRFWNARKEALSTAHCWLPLLGQHAVIPVTAYVEHSPNETWNQGERAWMPALIKGGQGGGIAVITDDDQSPILTTQEHAIAWLNAKRWDVIPTLDKMKRVKFEEPDIFIQARLSADARSRVPVRRSTRAA